MWLRISPRSVLLRKRKTIPLPHSLTFVVVSENFGHQNLCSIVYQLPLCTKLFVPKETVLGILNFGMPVFSYYSPFQQILLSPDDLSWMLVRPSWNKPHNFLTPPLSLLMLFPYIAHNLQWTSTTVQCFAHRKWTTARTFAIGRLFNVGDPFWTIVLPRGNPVEWPSH